MALAALSRPAPLRRCSVRVRAARASCAPPVPGAGEHAALLQEASDAVHRAARLCLDIRSRFDASGAASLSKSDATPVTVADFGVQALISLQLGAAYPSIPLVAEEDAASLRDPSSAALLQQVTEAVLRSCAPSCAPASSSAVLDAIDRGLVAVPGATARWVLDPIDGTRGFLRGGDAQYCVGLALLDDSCEEGPALGVMALPNWQLPPASAERRGAVLAASRGGGAWIRSLASEDAPWQRAFCDAAAQLRSATVCVSDHEAWSDTAMAAKADEEPGALLPLCCGSLVKYAAVATGQASLFVQHPVPGVHRLKSWDHAAGVACVLAAGGAVVDFSGRAVALGTGRDFVPAGLGVLVCNAPLHRGALALLPPPGPRPRLALLDRDGCLNHDQGTWIMRAQDLRLLPGAGQAVAALNAAGITTAIVTNQSCVGRGMLSWQGLDDVHAEMTRQLDAAGARIDALYVAPDDPDSGAVSARRKPGPGMLQEALSSYGVPPEACFMAGDTVGDMRAAAAAGVASRFLLCTGHGARYAAAAAEAGIALPTTVRDDGGAIASLLPREVLPLRLHADLASAVQEVLAS
jgi:3'(2'), 5'-bisphosphate nucleotidase